MNTLPYTQVHPKDAARTAFLYPASPSLEEHRLIVEIGPGRGDFLFYLASTIPNATIVGIEIKRRRVDKLIPRIEKQGLTNIRVIQDDARHALPSFFEGSSVDEIYINFPDPWPKRRHTKNRAVSRSFLKECFRVLKPKGTLSIATDSEIYAQEIAQTITQVRGFTSCFNGDMATDLPDAYPTHFARKWQDEGRTIFYLKYQRVI